MARSDQDSIRAAGGASSLITNAGQRGREVYTRLDTCSVMCSHAEPDGLRLHPYVQGLDPPPKKVYASQKAACIKERFPN
eukprot:1161229-Pelagomonas_calceolata.AAC.10